ncbi:hypothetical protein UY3_06708 [Chelonia mydas]|uniref:Uncharacterized protein n=1 Tax=Chelonia mydas TaxID=8469 RepID=M7C6E8_CHEMY|nr:hypothetical protein UY3_06708 [Chelonia mydas]
MNSVAESTYLDLLTAVSSLRLGKSRGVAVHSRTAYGKTVMELAVTCKWVKSTFEASQLCVDGPSKAIDSHNGPQKKLLTARALICTPDFTDLVYTFPFSFISCWCKDACGTAKPTDSCPFILHASFNSATLKYPECPQEVYGPDPKPTEINDGRRGFPVTSMNIVSCPKALLSNANWYYINVTPLLKAVAAHPKLA